MKDVGWGVYYLFSGIIIAFIPYGIILYVVVHYSNATPTSLQPFELAIVTALLGGFTLAGSFSTNGRLVSLASTLRKISAIYILATISFFVFGLFLPLTENTLAEEIRSQASPVVSIGICAGVVLFTIATGWLLFGAIPKMFREN